jgi:hypothetical protein
MRRNVALILLVICGLFTASASSPASAAAARNPSGDHCHGYVKNFYKETGRIYMHYTLRCDQAEDTIVVNAMLRQADRINQLQVRCHHTSFCTSVASLADHTGSQKYYGSTYAGDVSSGVSNDGHGVVCQITMPCTGAARTF